METLISILQALSAIGLVSLLAIQTSKAEQGGVMGIGGAGGRGTGEVDMLVGTERILKPLTRWLAIGFLFLSLLKAIPDVGFVHFIVVLAIYLASMIFGGAIWRVITGNRS